MLVQARAAEATSCGGHEDKGARRRAQHHVVLAQLNMALADMHVHDLGQLPRQLKVDGGFLPCTLILVVREVDVHLEWVLAGDDEPIALAALLLAILMQARALDTKALATGGAASSICMLA